MKLTNLFDAELSSSQIVIVLVFGLPESPRYLYKHGRSEEALAILCDVYDGTPNDPKIAKENSEILEALKVEQEHGEYKWSQLLKRDKVQTGRRVLLAYGMQFCNQMGKFGHYTDILYSILKKDRWYQFSGLLHHVGIAVECWSYTKPQSSLGRSHQPHVSMKSTSRTYTEC